MSEMFFAGALLIVLLTSFVQSFNWSGWNRGYLGLYGGVIESSVQNYMPYRPAAVPHFEKPLLQYNLEQYVSKNMSPYSVETTFSIALSDDHGGGEYQTVSISFWANLGFREITKEAVFHIVEVES